MRFDSVRKKQYLECLALGGNRTDACRAANVNRRTVYDHENVKGASYSPEFEEDVENAMREFKDSLRREIHRRGVTGVEEPVFYQGDEIAQVTKYSDRMLELLAKSHIPELRDRSTVDSNVKSDVTVSLSDLSELDGSEREVLRDMLERRREALDN